MKKSNIRTTDVSDILSFAEQNEILPVKEFLKNYNEQVEVVDFPAYQYDELLAFRIPDMFQEMVINAKRDMWLLNDMNSALICLASDKKYHVFNFSFDQSLSDQARFSYMTMEEETDRVSCEVIYPINGNEESDNKMILLSSSIFAQFLMVSYSHDRFSRHINKSDFIREHPDLHSLSAEEYTELWNQNELLLRAKGLPKYPEIAYQAVGACIMEFIHR